MFNIDKTLTRIDPSLGTVTKALVSISPIMVAISGYPVQETEAYACSFRHHNGSYSLYVLLHMPKSDQRVVYVPEPPKVYEKHLPALEEEARNFLEAMGFVLDQIDVAELPDDEQIRWVESCPLFSSARPPAAAPPPPVKAAPEPEASKLWEPKKSEEPDIVELEVEVQVPEPPARAPTTPAPRVQSTREGEARSNSANSSSLLRAAGDPQLAPALPVEGATQAPTIDPSHLGPFIRLLRWL